MKRPTGAAEQFRRTVGTDRVVRSYRSDGPVPLGEAADREAGRLARKDALRERKQNRPDGKFRGPTAPPVGTVPPAELRTPDGGRGRGGRLK